MRKLAGPGRLTVLVLQEEATSSLDRLSETWGGRRAPEGVRFTTPSTAAREDLEGPLLVVGSFGEAAAAYLSTTPCRSFDPPATGEILRVTSVNPWDPSSPMILLTGGDLSSVETALESGPWPRSWDYEVVRGGTRVRYGRYTAAAEGWRVDPASDEDIRARIRAETIGPLGFERVEGELGSGEAAGAAARVLDDLKRFVRRLGGTLPEGARPAIHLHLHADPETKGMRTGDPRPGHIAPRVPGAPVFLHLALDGERGTATWGPDERIAIARAAIRIALGDLQPRSISDGAAVLMAGGVLGHDLRWWEARLAGSTAAPSARELWRDDETATRSYLVLMPLRALALERLEGKDGAATLGALLRRPGLPAELERIPPAPAPARPPGARPAGSAAAWPLQKGMGLAHEGYGVVDGYGSRNASEQMSRLKALGVGWVALSPYGFMAEPREASIRFNGSEEQGAGSENDHAVLATMRAARAMGLKVMLKPQIWLPRGHWTGEVVMDGEEEWGEFFVRYGDFLSHYALLAAAGGADLLSIGVELQEATRREGSWRSLIAMTRGLFDGPLTYSANWGGEFEKLAFWDALDFAGLDCYYPLSDKGDPSDEELLRGARHAARHAEEVYRRTGRRILLTEVGFPALAGAWRAPHDDSREAGPDPEAQARAYRAILGAFAGKPWLAGIYWWKWPTTSPGVRPDPLFSPRGRPAERVIAEWYARLGSPAGDWPVGSP